MGCIYYHKNKINGHMYIGQSVCNSTNVKYGRWGLHGQGYKSNKYFWNAIKKYGWENFEHGFFEDNISNDLLNEKEKYYIALYHTCRQDSLYQGGYNLTLGGENSMNTWWPEEDAWLYDNYSIDKTRDELVKEYREVFPESCHTDMAIKARLKTLRLSTADNVHFWSDTEIAALIDLWPTASKAEICAALPNRAYESIRSKAKLLKLAKRNSFMESEVSYIRDNKKITHKVYLPYTKAEDNLIIECFPEYGVEYCRTLLREKLGVERTYNSVKDRANKVLKLRRNKKV